MADSPLTEVKSALTSAYENRKKRLEDGSGEFPLWEAPKTVDDTDKANSTAGDVAGAAIADGSKPFNVIPAYRQSNMLLSLARDREAFSRDRIERGGDYLKAMERELKFGLKARLL